MAIASQPTRRCDDHIHGVATIVVVIAKHVSFAVYQFAALYWKRKWQ
jgi:hypothetical protein